jgi:riboflavin kinase/FMN adenylyltransferase
VFDGVHLGHQALVAKAVDVAREYGLVPVALTFRNHPLSVLAPPYTPRRLVTPARKAALLQSLGIEIVVMVDFSREFAAMDPETFIQQCLVSKANAAKLVCGYDFSFGCQGAGNLTLLRELGGQFHFDVFDVEAVSRENHPVKSTHIRDLLSAGHVAQAVGLLTRPHEVPGVVGSGMQRGRKIGFPTANLQVLDNYQVPAGGVYLCGARVGINEYVRPAMVNIGTSPTFGENAVTVEAHILDFSGDINNEPLSLFFMERLRDERKFPGIDALVEQLQKDREQTAGLWSSDVIKQMISTVPGPVDHHSG